MKKLFKKRTFCLRCGGNNDGTNDGGCSNWGKWFDKHLWNEEDIVQEVDTVITVQRVLDKDNGAKEVFKAGATLKMDKNRRTGITKKIYVCFENGKLRELEKEKREEIKKEEAKTHQEEIEWQGFE